jgi:hypothetical protein
MVFTVFLGLFISEVSDMPGGGSNLACSQFLGNCNLSAKNKLNNVTMLLLGIIRLVLTIVIH